MCLRHFFSRGRHPLKPWQILRRARWGFSEDAPAAYTADFLSTPEALHLNLAFARIHDPKVRKRIVDLVSSLAGDDERPAPLASGAPDPDDKPAE